MPTGATGCLDPLHACQELSSDLRGLSGYQDGGSCSSAAEPPAMPDEQRTSLHAGVKNNLSNVLTTLQAENADLKLWQQGFLEAELPMLTVFSLQWLEFEERKDVVKFFCLLLRADGMQQPMGDHLRSRDMFVRMLADGCNTACTATHCGMILQSLTRHKSITEVLLGHSDRLPIRLVEISRNSSFDISSEAFSSLQRILLTHKEVSAEFLSTHYCDFFESFNVVLRAADYIAQRQSLKLLSEILLDRHFTKVMLQYIGNVSFLQIHMNLLRDESQAIQFEAFHVFKIFVANPQKPAQIQQILFQNKERLLKLLDKLRATRADDKRFADDKRTVISKLQALEAPPVLPRSASSVASAMGSSAHEQEPGSPAGSVKVA
mmetsp:Transcript_11045/g.20041  ORF Transcript_11045/g.20041 Transcript_11045/m.20041 type:complete len:377 (+) Transcript_11045:70-1200(+)